MKMRKHLVMIKLTVLIASASMAQCDSKVLWQATKLEFLDSNRQVVKTEEALVQVITSPDYIVFRKGKDGSDRIEGKITIQSCHWNKPLNSGKSILTADLAKPNGEHSMATVIIEGANGMVAILLSMERPEGIRTMRIPINSATITK